MRGPKPWAFPHTLGTSCQGVWTSGPDTNVPWSRLNTTAAGNCAQTTTHKKRAMARFRLSFARSATHAAQSWLRHTRMAGAKATRRKTFPRSRWWRPVQAAGKSTAAKAFAVTVTRTTEANGFPLGCVLLVHHVHTANVAHSELEALLPGRVAVFTAENDAERGAIRKPAFTADELETYPVLVTTHEFYKQIRGHKAR